MNDRDRPVSFALAQAWMEILPTVPIAAVSAAGFEMGLRFAFARPWAVQSLLEALLREQASHPNGPTPEDSEPALAALWHHLEPFVVATGSVTGGEEA